MKNQIDLAYEKAIDCLKKCSTPNGFFASGAKDGYDAIWSRDTMISSLGASLVKNKDGQILKKAFKESINTLKKAQSKNGQIPNCVDNFAKRAHHTDYKSIDSSLWYIIGNSIYKERYGFNIFSLSNKSSIKNALSWLKCQDTGEIGMLAQLPTSDWQDAFPHRYGYTINTQALYYKALDMLGKKKEAEKIKKFVNEDKDDCLWNGEFYLSYRWKNHGVYREIGDWFDSLANLLAIVFDLADKPRAEKILSYIEKNKINQPYPMKTIYPPIDEESKYWQDYYLDCDAGTPNHYSNGGIWGFIGGFYVLALIKMKKFKRAEEELKKMAERDINGNFPEWTNPLTKEHHGSIQAWEAGMYILAYESFKQKKVLI
jgi:glycogen debranching enzyme